MDEVQGRCTDSGVNSKLAELPGPKVVICATNSTQKPVTCGIPQGYFFVLSIKVQMTDLTLQQSETNTSTLAFHLRSCQLLYRMAWLHSAHKAGTIFNWWEGQYCIIRISSPFGHTVSVWDFSCFHPAVKISVALKLWTYSSLLNILFTQINNFFLFV